MILLITAIAFLIILAGLLIFPIRLIIDTDKNYYMAGMPGILAIYAVPDELLFQLKARILFIPIKLTPQKWIRHKNISSDKKKYTKPKFKIFRAITRSFAIKQLDLVIDTCNPMSNALISGIATPYLNQTKNINININYYGEYMANIILQSRLILILLAIIKYK